MMLALGCAVVLLLAGGLRVSCAGRLRRERREYRSIQRARQRSLQRLGVPWQSGRHAPAPRRP